MKELKVFKDFESDIFFRPAKKNSLGRIDAIDRAKCLSWEHFRTLVILKPEMDKVIEARQSLHNCIKVIDKHSESKELLESISYYIRGKMPGRKAYRTLFDNKLITPLEEKEYFEFLIIENTDSNESWRTRNWGTNCDIYQARLKLNKPMLETSFKTNWQPPVEALKCLLEWDSVEDIKLAFHSFESGFMGTWINGKEDRREYIERNTKSENECSQMYDDLFSAEL